MSVIRSLLRSTPLVVFGSTAARARELHSVDEMVRVPIPLSRRIGFVQMRGGAGASSTAAYIANLLARRREGPVLAVDASGGENGMLWHTGLPHTAEQRSSRRRAGARRAADAVDGLPLTASGLWTLSIAAPHAAGAAPTDAWFDQCSPISRFFELVITDWGVRDPRVDLSGVVAASHVLCLVARADRHSAEQTLAVIEAIRREDNPPAVVVALTDVGSTGIGSSDLERAAVNASIHVIPYDLARASARPLSSPALATRTRLAYGRLARDLIAVATVGATS